jgi:hypothetical protein
MSAENTNGKDSIRQHKTARMAKYGKIWQNMANQQNHFESFC